MNSSASSSCSIALRNELKTLHDMGLQRRLRIPSLAIRSFAHNDYLGLSRDPRIAAAAVQVLQDWGTGAGAARLISGQTAWHKTLDDSLAALKKTEAALSFPTGFAAATGTLPALLKAGDYVVLDKLCHACIFDGAKLSGAHLKVFNHNDLQQAEDILQWIRTHTPTQTRILVVAESLYSMDGDFAPLKGLVSLKNHFGAWLMIDEAHATGVYGPQGRGLIAASGLSSEIEIQMGTLSKAIGVHGGFIAGSEPLIELLIHKARSFLFTTGTPPALAAAACKSLEIIQSAEGDKLRSKLQTNIGQYLGNPNPPPSPPSPIQLIEVGSEAQAARLSQIIQELGFLVPSVRFPTVPLNQARLRVTLSSGHSKKDIEELVHALHQAVELSDKEPSP